MDAESPAGLPGVPDAFQRLWTPHRMAYIKAGPQVLRDACPFCAAPGIKCWRHRTAARRC